MKKLIAMINVLMLVNIIPIQSMEEYEQASVLVDVSKDKLSHKDTDYLKKNKSLEKIINTIKPDQDSSHLLDEATQLVRAGANPNIIFMDTIFMSVSLLHKALLMNAESLVKALFEHGADCAHEHFFTGPIFFDAPTTEIAQLFIDKGIDVNQVNGNGHNVLWHLIDPKFSSELVRFYLEYNVNVNHICEFDGSCILHGLAAHKVKDEDDFLTKAQLIFAQTSPDLVNTIDHHKKTPVMLAEEQVVYLEKSYPSGVGPLRKLINLFKEVV